MSELRVKYIAYTGTQTDISLDAARRLIAEERKQYLKRIAPIEDAIQALKVKCTTCRCKIVPGELCTCCGDTSLDHLFTQK